MSRNNLYGSETLIASFVKDPEFPTLTIDVGVDQHGNIVIAEYGDHFTIPAHLGEEISSAIFIAWESSEDVVAAHKAAEDAKKLAEQAKQAVLEKISRGGKP